MGSCVICGKDVDGVVCQSHEEDIVFEFEGSAPDQLTPGRYYRGSVDGFADFGVFVDIGDAVTGLLHTSELDRRLESIEWQPGESVYVQVKGVRENGNVDLGWSIRQHESEFRAKAIDDPAGDYLPDESEADEQAASTEPDAGSPSPSGQAENGETVTDTASDVGASGGSSETDRSTSESTEASTQATGGAAMETKLQRATIESLSEQIGDPVRIEGRLVEARQTSGPTVFEVRDETGHVDCAAFESAGVRAYPEVDTGDVVRLQGIVEERRGSIQVETESITQLEGDEQAAVEERLERAIAERARPEAVELLADHAGIEAVKEGIVAAATEIRRAVFESRPVVVRHSATVDGYVAGIAIERAVLPLIRAEHDEADAEYHYFDRRPLDGRIYGMDDAMRDTTAMLDARDRHGEAVPLFLFANAGSTEESRDSLELLGLYGARRLIVDGDYPDASMADAADAMVSPHLESARGEDVSTTALCANIAGHVSPDVRPEVGHLPAVSYWNDPPSAYTELAADALAAGRDVATLREAVALEAFYQAYEDKRELLADVLFGDHELAEHASNQFRERVDTEVRTAEPHLDELVVDGATLGVLDLESFTHQYEFPPAEVLLAELAAGADVDAIIGSETDGLIVWSAGQIDMESVGEAVAEAVPDGGVETRGGRDGSLAFLAGSREAVIDAAVRAVADQL